MSDVTSSLVANTMQCLLTLIPEILFILLWSYYIALKNAMCAACTQERLKDYEKNCINAIKHPIYIHEMLHMNHAKSKS